MYAYDTTLHKTYDTFHDTDNTDITTITHNINTLPIVFQFPILIFIHGRFTVDVIHLQVY